MAEGTKKAAEMQEEAGCPARRLKKKLGYGTLLVVV